MKLSFPTSSQLDRLAACAESVDISEPLKVREKIQPGQKPRSEMSSSEVGTLLHKAIESALITNERIRKFDKRAASFVLSFASDFDVFDDARDIDFSEIIRRYGEGYWVPEISFSVGYNSQTYDPVALFGVYEMPIGYRQEYAGQADAIIEFDDKVVVLDWKTGYSDSPDIETNRQLSSAALAVDIVERSEQGLDRPVEKAIFYTRTNRLVTAPFDRIKEWGSLRNVTPARGATRAGSHCRYCPKKADCGAFLGHSKELARRALRGSGIVP